MVVALICGLMAQGPNQAPDHHYIKNSHVLTKLRREFTFPYWGKDDSGIPIWAPETVNWLNLTLFPTCVADERYCLNCYGDMYARGGWGVLTLMKRQAGRSIKVFKIYVVPVEVPSDVSPDNQGTLFRVLEKLKIKVKGPISEEEMRRLSEKHAYAVYKTKPNAPIVEVAVIGEDGNELPHSSTAVETGSASWVISDYERKLCVKLIRR